LVLDLLAKDEVTHCIAFCFHPYELWCFVDADL